MMKLVFSLALIACLALAPVGALGFDRTFRGDVWTFKVPSEFTPAPGSPGAFKSEIDGPYHTLALWPVTWSGVFFPGVAAMPAEERVKLLFGDLMAYMIRHKTGFSETPLAPESRFSRVGVTDMPAEMYPDLGVCAGFGWNADDVSVPGREGAVHKLRGYSLYCAEFVDDAGDFHVLEFNFSERYCAAMGHKPYAAFEATATRIFRSVRFTAGPAHQPFTPSSEGGASPSADWAARLADTTTAFAELMPAGRCGG